MSAYGALAAPKPVAELEPLVYPLKAGSISLHPVSAAEAPRDLISYLHEVFARELEGEYQAFYEDFFMLTTEGKSYPQEGPIDYDAFASYFFTTASTTVIGILHAEQLSSPPASLEEARGNRSWEGAVGGCFYIKPNYPGRSSHNCNGGFIVPHATRGRGASHALAQAFSIYAPKLGYRASVFNLVYANNFSLKVWEKNGFQKVGTIPNGGRLRTGPDGTEEYVDAYVMYKSFV